MSAGDDADGGAGCIKLGVRFGIAIGVFHEALEGRATLAAAAFMHHC